MGVSMWSQVVLCTVCLTAYVVGNVIVYNAETHFIVTESLSLPAGFGPQLEPDGLRGLLVVSDPEHGCNKTVRPDVVNYTGLWILLVARYSCDFETKVRIAQSSGFDAVIVHNVNSSDLETMSAKDPVGIIIPSVFIGGPDAEELKDYTYDKSLSYRVKLNGDLPFDINTHLLLPFAIVVALCLIIMIIFMIVKCIKDRRRANRHRLPSRALRKIPTCKFSKGDPYDTCAICLDDYQEGDRLRVLPCAHAYHAKCIDPWLTRNRRVCPVCKRRVVSAGERRAPPDTTHSNSDSDDSRAPLLAATPDTQGGGTFNEQRENPFIFARLFMARLRARTNNQQNEESQSNADHSEDSDDSDHNNEEEHRSPDRAPLITPSVRTETERRRHRSAPSINSERAAPLYPAPPPPPAGPAPEGEIGVAAIPAPPSDNNNHLNL